MMINLKKILIKEIILIFIKIKLFKEVKNKIIKKIKLVLIKRFLKIFKNQNLIKKNKIINQIIILLKNKVLRIYLEIIHLNTKIKLTKLTVTVKHL